MSQALEVYSKIQNPFEAAIQMGEQLAKSCMFGVDRREAGAVLMLTCMTENLTPLDFIRTYDVVMGKIRKKALACYAEFRSRGGRCKWLNTGDDGKEAVGEFTFEGQTLTVRFSIEDAKKQGTVKKDSAWDKTPGNMLRARVITNAIGMLAPEIVAGMVDGDDESAPVAEPKTILQVKTDAPAAAPAKQESKPIDVEVVKTETASTPEPVATTPTAEPAKETPKEIFVAKAKPDGSLTGETVAAIQSVIGDENAKDFIDWLLLKQWIPAITREGTAPTGDISKMSVQRAQRILDKPEVVLNFIRGELKAAKA